jgi:hypothetical protein
MSSFVSSFEQFRAGIEEQHNVLLLSHKEYTEIVFFSVLKKYYNITFSIPFQNSYFLRKIAIIHMQFYSVLNMKLEWRLRINCKFASK